MAKELKQDRRQQYSSEETLEFKEPFQYDGQNARVERLFVITEARLKGSLLSLEQNIGGYAVSLNSDEVLNGKIGIAYKAYFFETHIDQQTDQMIDIKQAVDSYQRMRVDEIKAAYEAGRPLPASVGPLERL